MIESFGFGNFLDGISFLLILMNFYEIWAKWLLIFNFSVNHYGAICAIPLIFIFTFKNGTGIGNSIVYIIGNAIIIFMAFVYNEIIILRFCGLDKNTAIEISRRSIRDSSCDFGKDEDEIYVKSNENYIICKEDIGEINDEDYEMS